jgi:general secretion pathway protein K
MTTSRQNRGSALLAVLWLTAALSAIAFTVANSVRTETERTGTDVDSLKTYYLATAGIDRALLHIVWGFTINPKYYQPPSPPLRFSFATGDASVEVIQESAKLNINSASAEQLTDLALVTGATPAQAANIAAGILDWRTGSPGGFTSFDQHYLALPSSFHSRHASFQEVEELLLVQGVTPDLFYGSYGRNAEGNLTARPGLKDALSIYGSLGPIDANSVPASVMVAIGISPQAAAAIVALRSAAPITSLDQLAPFRDSGPGFGRLAINAGTVVTVRSTAWLRRADGQPSELRRSVAATVKFLGWQTNPPYHVLRWYDNAYSIK